jgi:hypothetical protein
VALAEIPAFAKPTRSGMPWFVISAADLRIREGRFLVWDFDGHRRAFISTILRL